MQTSRIRNAVPREWSTRTYLIALVVALLAPMLVFAGILVLRQAATERAAYEQAALSAARRITAAVDRELSGFLTALQVLSTAQARADEDLSGLYEQAAEVKAILGAEIIVKDVSGRQIINTRLPFGAALPTSLPPGDREAIETKRPFVSDLFMGATAQRPIVSINVPILRNGTVERLVIVGLDPARIAGVLQAQDLPRDWTAAVIDREGRIIARSRLHERFLGATATADLRERAAGQEGVWNGTTAEGTPVLSAYARSSLSGWRVAVGVPTETVEAPLRRTLWTLAAAGILALLLSLAVATWLGRRIAEPMRTLAAAGAALGRGEPNPRLPTTGISEINEAARALAGADRELQSRAQARDAAEAALRESEELFQSLAEALPQMVWIMRPEDGFATYANQRFKEYHGYDVAGDLADRSSTIHPDDKAEAWRIREPAVAAGLPFQADVRTRRHDGTYRWFRMSCVPLRRDGRVTTYVGTATDIDDMRRNQDALRESEQRLAIATAAADLGIWDWDLSSNTMIYSERAKTIFGFPPGEPVTYDQVRNATHPEDLPQTSAIARRAFDPAIREKIPYEYRIIRPDGAERWVVAHGEAVFAEVDGRTRAVRYTGTIQDITAQRSAQEALRESEARLRLAIEAGRMAVWAYDIATESVAGSPELNRVLGFPPDASPSLAEMGARYYPGEQERLRAIGQAALEQGERYFSAEYRYLWPDGSVRWLLMRAEIILQDGGAPASVVGVLVDITERKRAEEHQQLLINELNHRVKNTLATVQSIAAQSFRSEADADAARRNFEQRLLALSRTHDVLTRENWDGAELREIVDEAIAPYRRTGGGRFRVEGPPLRLSPAMALSLAMALNELATNAVKYGALSNDEGVVSVNWSVTPEPDGRRLTLSWTEAGGPLVAEPTRRGFGSRLIEKGLARELAGEVELRFQPAGVRCVIRAPITDQQRDGALDGASVAAA